MIILFGLERSRGPISIYYEMYCIVLYCIVLYCIYVNHNIRLITLTVNVHSIGVFTLFD